MPTRRREHRACLVFGKRAIVAKSIAIVRQPRSRNLRNQFLGYPAHIPRAHSCKLRRNSVRRQQRGHNRRRSLLIEPLHHAQHLQLRRALQPVARFRLHRRRARPQHPVAMPARLSQQLILSSRARHRHRAQNRSARRRNLLIRRPLNPLFKLRRAIPRKNQVRMRIHKSRRHAAAPGVDHCGVRRNSTPEFRVWSSGNDAAFFDEQRRFLHQPQFAQLRAHARTLGPSQRH